jgi:ribose/xylose/arabinose/galactoside ABC-type transport system permease subunit
MKRYFRELSVAIALMALLLALAIFAPAFYQPQPLLSLLTREAPTLVVACGMALVIICRQIDISVGSQFAVCSVCAGLLAAMNWPLVLVLPASVAIVSLTDRTTTIRASVRDVEIELGFAIVLVVAAMMVVAGVPPRFDAGPLRDPVGVEADRLLVDRCSAGDLSSVSMG